MNKKLFGVAVVMLLMLFFNTAQAQYYCFFVSNQSGETFNELKIRATNSGHSFSADLLPSNTIDDGKHFWIKTGNDDYEVYDVQITRLDGSPLLFTWKDVNGNWHKSKPFISVNVKDLHTLLIGSSDGNLNFEVYNNDEFGYGDPCQ